MDAHIARQAKVELMYKILYKTLSQAKRLKKRSTPER